MQLIICNKFSDSCLKKFFKASITSHKFMPIKIENSFFTECEVTHLFADKVINIYNTSPFSRRRKTGWTTLSLLTGVLLLNDSELITPAKSKEMTTSPKASAKVVFSGKQRLWLAGTEPTLIKAIGRRGLVIS